MFPCTLCWSWLQTGRRLDFTIIFLYTGLEEEECSKGVSLCVLWSSVHQQDWWSFNSGPMTLFFFFLCWLISVLSDLAFQYTTLHVSGSKLFQAVPGFDGLSVPVSVHKHTLRRSTTCWFTCKEKKKVILAVTMDAFCCFSISDIGCRSKYKSDYRIAFSPSYISSLTSLLLLCLSNHLGYCSLITTVFILCVEYIFKGKG